MIWHRGDNGSTKAGPTWYAADREYAEFYGEVVSLEVADAEVLDLTEHGVGPDGEWDEDGNWTPEVTELADGLPEYREIELYQYAERRDVQAAARALGYRAIRVMQWHSEFSGEPQDTLLVL